MNESPFYWKEEKNYIAWHLQKPIFFFSNFIHWTLRAIIIKYIEMHSVQLFLSLSNITLWSHVWMRWQYSILLMFCLISIDRYFFSVCVLCGGTDDRRKIFYSAHMGTWMNIVFENSPHVFSLKKEKGKKNEHRNKSCKAILCFIFLQYLIHVHFFSSTCFRK